MSKLDAKKAGGRTVNYPENYIYTLKTSSQYRWEVTVNYIKIDE